VKRDYANLPTSAPGIGGGEMASSDDTLFQLIKEQLSSFKEQLKDFKNDMRTDLEDLKGDIHEVKSDVESIKRDLGGQGGIRERVTAIEVKVQKAVSNTTASPFSVYPPAPQEEPKPRSKSIKERGGEMAVTAGGAGAVVAIIELIQSFIQNK
jgi:hypothetical protein